MKLIRVSTLLITSLVVNGCAEPAAEDHAEEAQGIHGGWVVSEWIMPENEVMAMAAEHGLFLFRIWPLQHDVGPISGQTDSPNPVRGGFGRTTSRGLHGFCC